MPFPIPTGALTTLSSAGVSNISTLPVQQRNLLLQQLCQPQPPALQRQQQQASDKDEPPSVFPWHLFPETTTFGRCTNRQLLEHNQPIRVQPRRVGIPAEFRGTAFLPFACMVQDEEDGAVFHSISAMTSYASKSAEELRMEDYEQRGPGCFQSRMQSKTHPNVLPLPRTTLVQDEPMDYEILRDDWDVAVFLAEKFFATMAQELARAEWNDVRA